MSDSRNPKIQIDEDWKNRIEAERATLASEEQDAEAEARQRLPQASIATLISNFATQALVSLGSIPDPQTGRPVVDLELARFAIDSIEVISDKTQGNLDANESRMVENALLELRMAYLEVSKNPGAVTGAAAEQAEAPPKIITP